MANEENEITTKKLRNGKEVTWNKTFGGPVIHVPAQAGVSTKRLEVAKPREAETKAAKPETKAEKPAPVDEAQPAVVVEPARIGTTTTSTAFDAPKGK